MTEPSTYTPSWYAAHTPDRPAVVMGGTGETLTYAELDAGSRRFAQVLRSHGIGPGGHVAILMENNLEYLEVAWAAQRAGLYYTAVNSHLLKDEVQYILDDCGAQALVTSTAMADVVTRLDLSRIGLRVCVGELSGFESYDALVAAQGDGPLEDELEGREMLYSSGTTGRPKGIRKELSLTPFGDPESRPVKLTVAIEGLLAGAGSVYLSPAPLYHSAPLVYSMTLHRLGATVVVMERFDARAALDLIERHRVTLAQFVPTMFTRMLRLPEEERARRDLSSLRMVLHSAAPCPVPVKQAMMDWWGPIIHEYYAGTEDVGSTHITPQEWLEHPGSIGRPLDECHILGADGEELPDGEPGAVYFKSANQMTYHNDPDKTASVTSEQGWRTMGDIGYRDADGYLYLTDRQAHMIISGGVNIYPQETENVLACHPAVADVAVIGVPDQEMGEAVKAVVQAADPARADADLARELVAYCRDRLAAYKCPRSVDFVEELPRDPNGKLYKRRLRERYWAGHGSLVL